MRITTVGRGRVGGGLSRRWSAAGHEVTALGRDGGDASGSEVVVVAIPGDAIADGLRRSRASRARSPSTRRTSSARPYRLRLRGAASQVLHPSPNRKSVQHQTSPFGTTRSTRNRCRGHDVAADTEAHDTTERLIRDAGSIPSPSEILRKRLSGEPHRPNRVLETGDLGRLLPLQPSRRDLDPVAG